MDFEYVFVLGNHNNQTSDSNNIEIMFTNTKISYFIKIPLEQLEVAETLKFYIPIISCYQ